MVSLVAASTSDDHLLTQAAPAAFALAQPGAAIAKDTTRNFVASWLAFAAGMAAAYPLDTIRVRWQTLGQPPLHTLRHDGVRSLFAGITTPTFVLGPVVAAQFALFEGVKPTIASTGYLRVERDLADAANHHRHTHALTPFARLCRPLSTVLPNSGFTVAETFAAGTVAGAAAVAVVTPVTVVRVLQQNSACGGRCTEPLRSVAARIRREDGWRGFWRTGFTMVALNGIGRGIYFAGYDGLKHALGDDAATTSSSTTSAVAALGATTAWLAFAFPLDLLITRTIAARGATSVRAELHTLLRRDGWRGGLYRGFSLALMRSAVWSGIQLPVYDLLKGHGGPHAVTAGHPLQSSMDAC